MFLVQISCVWNNQKCPIGVLNLGRHNIFQGSPEKRYSFKGISFQIPSFHMQFLFFPQIDLGENEPGFEEPPPQPHPSHSVTVGKLVVLLNRE